MKNNICIVGIGGRTGVMFARELQTAANVFGVGLAREVEMINNKRISVMRGGSAPEFFEVEAAGADEFAAFAGRIKPDFLWMAIKNPVADAVEYYYREFKHWDNLPALILSQNGLSAINDAREGLKKALGADADRVAIIRVSVINGVDLAVKGGASVINYKLPIKLGFGPCITPREGQNKANELAAIFEKAALKAQRFSGGNVVKMENSKLFTNLIGMAAASRGMGVSDGFRDKKIFKEEVAMLKEFVLAVKSGGLGFLPVFAGYPIGFLANLMLLPDFMLVPFRGIFERIVAKGRNRPKDMFEIDYYNGEAVKLGKKFGVATPENEMVMERAKKIIKK